MYFGRENVKANSNIFWKVLEQIFMYFVRLDAFWKNLLQILMFF